MRRMSILRLHHGVHSDVLAHASALRLVIIGKKQSTPTLSILEFGCQDVRTAKMPAQPYVSHGTRRTGGWVQMPLQSGHFSGCGQIPVIGLGLWIESKKGIMKPKASRLPKPRHLRTKVARLGHKQVNVMNAAMVTSGKAPSRFILYFTC